MELRHIHGFLAVAEELHFHRAAKKLHIAQPALSQQIAQLEHELGVRLFDRSTRSVSLTMAGEAFLDPARRALAELELARTSARGGVHTGTVRVGFTRASLFGVLPTLLRAVRAREPGLRLDIHGSLQAITGLSALRSRELDLAFVRVAPQDREIATRIVRLDPLHAVVAEDHPAAREDQIALADLAADPFVTFPALRGSAVRDALVRSCREAGFDPRIVRETDDSDMILSLVAAGVGVTLMTPTVGKWMPGAVGRPLKGPPVEIPLELAWRPADPSPALQRVLEIARTALPTPTSG